MDHDHVPALTALLYLGPLTMLLLVLMQAAAARGWVPAVAALRRLESPPVTTGLASLLLLVAGAIHIGLVPGHLEQPVLAVTFAVAGLACGFLAVAVAASDRWRAPAALLLLALLAAYGWTRVTGSEGVDALGIVAVVIELLGLAALARRAPTGPWTGPRRSQPFAEPEPRPTQDLLPTKDSWNRN